MRQLLPPGKVILTRLLIDGSKMAARSLSACWRSFILRLEANIAEQHG
jgi:hypothetical protein